LQGSLSQRLRLVFYKKETGVRVLPGAYLSQDTQTGNPGKHYIRVAMVAPKAETERGLTQIRDCLYGAEDQ